MAQKYGKKVKELMVKEMKNEISENKGFVISSMDNVKAVQIDVLRKRIKKSGSRYLVVKNRLAGIALKEAGIEGLGESVKEKKILGISIIKSDPVQVAKLLVEFSKENKGFIISSGYLEGVTLTANRVKELSEMPSKEQLIATVLSMMNAPIAGFVGVLSSVMRSIMYALTEIKNKKEGQQ